MTDQVNEPSSMYRIALVNMPFGAVHLPSIALTQLKAVTERMHGDRVSVDVLYLNQEFGEYMGLPLYRELTSMSHHASGIGDWLFRPYAFPELEDNAEEYFLRYYPQRTAADAAFRETILEKRQGIGDLLDRMVASHDLAGADLVGFTSMFAQNVSSIAMARKLKQRSPALITALGGANCESPMGDALAAVVKDVDFVFSGPALRSFPELVGHLADGKRQKLPRIDGVFSSRFADEPGTLRVVAAPDRGRYGKELDIDAAVPLDYDAFLKGLRERFGGAVAPALLFETSRGCWWGQRAHCTFCGLNGSTMRFRALRPDLALEQFAALFRHADECSRLASVDNILPRNYLEEVLPFLDTPDHVGIFYEVRADLSDEELQVLARAGVRWIQPGIEALNTSTLKLMRKGTTVFQNLRFLMSCGLYDVEPAWNLLIGFPFEDRSVYERYLDELPSFVHLPPPSGVYPVRFDRFSPYHEQPEAYDLALEPLDYYALTYPFAPEVLNAIAYYFQDRNYDAPYLTGVAQLSGKLRERVQEWRDRWDGPDGRRPELYLMDGAGPARVCDSRSGTPVEIEIGPAGLAILQNLDSPRKLPHLAERVPDLPLPELEATVAELHAAGLVYRDGDRFMSVVHARRTPSGEVAGGSHPVVKRLTPANAANGAVRADARRSMPSGDGAIGFPLSSAQRRLWFLAELRPDDTTYNMPFHLRLRGRLDHRALENAVGRIVERHEILRTSFQGREGVPMQVVTPAADTWIEHIDLSWLDREMAESRASEIAAAHARRPFALERAPLLRAALVRLTGTEHLFLLCMHHIVSDGWSMDVFFRELSALYAAGVAGEPAALPELSVQYVDFAVWERNWLQSPAAAAQGEFWRERLRGAPTVLDLPTDSPRAPVAGTRGSTYVGSIPASLAGPLGAIARREGATMYMVLLAALAELLRWHSGQTDFLVGAPVAGRARTELEPLVGCFPNVIPLRMQLAGDPSFTELLARVKATCLESFAHQEFPFDEIVDAVQPQRSTSVSPLIQVLFAFYPFRPPPLRLPGIEAEPVRVETGRHKFDLSFTVEGREDGLELRAEYDAELFRAATVRRLCGQYVELLENVAADPRRPVSRLRPSTEAGGVTSASPPPARTADGGAGTTVHDLFMEQVRIRGRETALVCGESALSYAELDRRASSLARRLRAGGVGTDVVVGVCLPRDADMVLAVLGVIKAGGAYLPLDPASPPERLSFMLRDAGARVVVTDEATLGRMALPAEVRLVLVDGADRLPDGEAEAGFAARAHPRSLAYVIYTSGSTGQPKAVAVEHRNLTAFLGAVEPRLGVTPGSRVLGATSLSFDVSVAEIFGTLCRGGTLVLTQNAMTLPDLPHPVRVAMLVPSAAAGLVRAGGLPPGVILNLGGEVLSANVVGELYRAGAKGVRNLYGPTENTVYSTVAEISRGERRVTIGRPLAAVRPYVVDPELHAAPDGTPGELCLGGAQVARGYLGRPTLTAERFVPDPFADEAGARMYRTGDRVQVDANGGLDFLGRFDRQVKISGYRVELGEVEAALREHPRVDDCVVTVRDAGSSRVLVAYCVAGEADAAELRAFLQARLPDYMVPAAFVPVERFPRLASGKVDERALQAREVPREAPPPPAAPREGVEAVVAELWEEILGVERVDPVASFFDSGGNSLLVAQLHARLASRLGTRLNVIDLFRNPSIRQLAAHLEAAAEGKGEIE